MELLVDGNPFELEEPCHDLKTCVQQVEKRLAAAHRVIVHIHLDGRDLSPEDENLLATYDVKKIEKLEIASEAPKNLVLEGLKDSTVVFEEVFGQLEKVVANLRAVQIKEASGRIQALADYLVWMITLCRNLPRSHPKFVEGKEGKLMTRNMKDLEAITREILGHQKNEDWVSLADVLEFELTEKLRYFQDIFGQLAATTEVPDA